MPLSRLVGPTVLPDSLPLASGEDIMTSLESRNLTFSSTSSIDLKIHLRRLLSPILAAASDRSQRNTGYRMKAEEAVDIR